MLYSVLSRQTLWTRSLPCWMWSPILGCTDMQWTRNLSSILSSEIPMVIEVEIRSILWAKETITVWVMDLINTCAGRHELKVLEVKKSHRRLRWSSTLSGCDGCRTSLCLWSKFDILKKKCFHPWRVEMYWNIWMNEKITTMANKETEARQSIVGLL